MNTDEVLLHPSDKVVFEPTLDDLVEDVERDYLVDVGTRKVIREGLPNACKFSDVRYNMSRLHSQSGRR